MSNNMPYGLYVFQDRLHRLDNLPPTTVLETSRHFRFHWAGRPCGITEAPLSMCSNSLHPGAGRSRLGRCRNIRTGDDGRQGLHAAAWPVIISFPRTAFRRSRRRYQGDRTAPLRRTRMFGRPAFFPRVWRPTLLPKPRFGSPASACTARKSTSRPYSPVRSSD